MPTFLVGFNLKEEVMNKADNIFKKNILNILNNGTWDEDPRPRYKSDQTPAHSLYVTQVFEEYDISNNEIPISELRPIPTEKGIQEIQWIYQDQTSDLGVLENKYGIMWWRDWEVLGTNSIGQRYGATVKEYDLMNNFLEGLVQDPFGRRHIISLWQNKDFEKPGLNPCAFQVIGSVRKLKNEIIPYFDMTLIQRSSDYLVAGHINKMQYVAFMMMVAKHCGFKVGKFCHFVQNLHVYDRHIDQAKELLFRAPAGNKIQFNLNVEDGTNFYDINASDFELINYYPIKPQLKFDLGI
jgi:thymidylate synthase